MLRNRFTPSRLLTALLLPLALGACSDDPLGPQFPEDVEFAPELGVNLSEMEELSSGVFIQTLTEGEGLPISEGEVTVQYTLWLPDGRQMDSGTFSFDFGQGEVIPGFEIGVSGMKVGEERLIVLPSELAYGASGQGDIPPQSVLVFRVELLSASGTQPA